MSELNANAECTALLVRRESIEIIGLAELGQSRWPSGTAPAEKPLIHFMITKVDSQLFGIRRGVRA